MRRLLDRFLVRLDRLILGIFFREIEVVGRHNVPRVGPLLVVANHVNSLVDPMLVYGFLPRRSRFLAKSTLWKHPVARYLVRLAAAIPVYRRQDPGVDPSRNREMFSRCHEELAAGGTLALFPEGQSHSEPALLRLKTGVARIALGAEERFGPLGLSILPVGLNFEDPDAFRSRVMIRIGRPLAVPEAERTGTEESTEEEEEREQVRDLTAKVEEALHQVTLSFDSWRQAELLQCAAEVYSRGPVEAPRRARLSDQFELKKAFLAGYRALARRHPEAVVPVFEATERYDRVLRRLRLEDRHVAATYPSTLVVRFLARHLWALALWPPLALAGALLNWLPYKIPGWVTRWVRLKPDVRATWKVLTSVVLFPLFWTLEAALVGWRFGGWWGLFTLLIAPASGYLALTYAERWRSLRQETAAYLKIRGRRGAAAALREKRRRVSEEIGRLSRLYEETFEAAGSPTVE